MRIQRGFDDRLVRHPLAGLLFLIGHEAAEPAVLLGGQS
jgi:hypothetical protein